MGIIIYSIFINRSSCPYCRDREGKAFPSLPFAFLKKMTLPGLYHIVLIHILFYFYLIIYNKIHNKIIAD